MTTPLVTLVAPPGPSTAVVLGANSYPIISGMCTVPTSLSLTLLNAGFIYQGGTRANAAFQ